MGLEIPVTTMTLYLLQESPSHPCHTEPIMDQTYTQGWNHENSDVVQSWEGWDTNGEVPISPLTMMQANGHHNLHLHHQVDWHHRVVCHSHSHDQDLDHLECMPSVILQDYDRLLTLFHPLWALSLGQHCSGEQLFHDPLICIS